MTIPIKSTALAIEAVASNPIPGTPNYWTRLSDGHPIFSDAASVDHDLFDAALLVESLTVDVGPGVSPGDVVVWATGGKILSSTAVDNLTTICGVAMEGGAPGVSIRVCRGGRVPTNLAGGPVTTGQLLGTVFSGGGGAGACGGSAPGAGAILGRAAGASGGGSVICDVVLG
jgi:hypothetical protein